MTLKTVVKGNTTSPRHYICNLVCNQNFLHLHSLCVGILFNSTALGIHLRKTSQPCDFKTRLGGEICSSDVNMHKGYYSS